MAGGWTRDGAVQDQIDDTIKDAVEAARARLMGGELSNECDDCGEPIAEKRRQAIPGTRTCVSCQSIRDKRVGHSAINRREARTANCAEVAEIIPRACYVVARPENGTPIATLLSYLSL